MTWWVFSTGWISTQLTELKLFHDYMAKFSSGWVRISIQTGVKSQPGPKRWSLLLWRIYNVVRVYYLTSARVWLHLKVEQTEIKPLKGCFFNLGWIFLSITWRFSARSTGLNFQPKLKFLSCNHFLCFNRILSSGRAEILNFSQGNRDETQPCWKLSM
jgi:hypothetical protein